MAGARVLGSKLSHSIHQHGRGGSHWPVGWSLRGQSGRSSGGNWRGRSLRGAESLGGGVVGRDEDRRSEVEGSVAIIGGVVVMMGGAAVVRSSEAGSETHGGDGAIGS